MLTNVLTMSPGLLVRKSINNISWATVSRPDKQTNLAQHRWVLDPIAGRCNLHTARSMLVWARLAHSLLIGRCRLQQGC
jgi:hypothetical protein